ncbi:hypothetical protein ACOSP7_020521 [Xanthoceras sorbifolium]
MSSNNMQEKGLERYTVEEVSILASPEVQEEDNNRKGKQKMGCEIVGRDLMPTNMGDSTGKVVQREKNYFQFSKDCANQETDQQTQTCEVEASISSKKVSKSNSDNNLNPGSMKENSGQGHSIDTESGTRVFVFGGSVSAGKRSLWKRRARGFNNTQSMEVENSHTRKRNGDNERVAIEAVAVRNQLEDIK